MRRIIDLSTPIVENHFRWKVDRALKISHESGDGVQATWAGWIMHGFTHMDTPRHFDPNGFTTDELKGDKKPAWKDNVTHVFKPVLIVVVAFDPDDGLPL